MFAMPEPKAPSERTVRRKKRVEKKMVFDMTDEVGLASLFSQNIRAHICPAGSGDDQPGRAHHVALC
jgi:hypothetical protein